MQTRTYRMQYKAQYRHIWERIRTGHYSLDDLNRLISCV